MLASIFKELHLTDMKRMHDCIPLVKTSKITIFRPPVKDVDLSPDISEYMLRVNGKVFPMQKILPQWLHKNNYVEILVPYKLDHVDWLYSAKREDQHSQNTWNDAPLYLGCMVLTSAPVVPLDDLLSKIDLGPLVPFLEFNSLFDSSRHTHVELSPSKIDHEGLYHFELTVCLMDVAAIAVMQDTPFALMVDGKKILDETKSKYYAIIHNRKWSIVSREPFMKLMLIGLPVKLTTLLDMHRNKFIVKKLQLKPSPPEL